jgi:hypothetical protein
MDETSQGPLDLAANNRLIPAIERRFGVRPTGFILLALTDDEIRIACQVNHPEDAIELSEALAEESENILRHYAAAMASRNPPSPERSPA